MPAQGLGKKGPVNRSSSLPAAGVPGGATKNDLLRWDATLKKWVVIAAPEATGTYVLGVVDGVLTWMDTEDC